MTEHQDAHQPQRAHEPRIPVAAGDDGQCPLLCAADARILDFLAEHGFDLSKLAQLPAEDHPRAVALVRQMDLLELYPVEPPHESIVDATLARIDHFESDRTEAMRVGSGRRRRLRLADLVSVAALVLVGLGVMLPIASQMRAQSLTTVCSSNLRSLGGGLASYASEHGGSMPALAGIGGGFGGLFGNDPVPAPVPSGSARAPRGTAMPVPQSGLQWSTPMTVKRGADGRSITLTPDWGTYNHSANLALLVAKGYCPVHSMRCPGCASGAACFAYKVPAQGVRFQFDTPYRMVVVADANPVIELRRNGQQIDRSVLSSRNHGEAGQNLLFSDASVEWRTSPILSDSPAKFMDNIWLPRGEDGREHLDLKVRPKDPKDTFVAQ